MIIFVLLLIHESEDHLLYHVVDFRKWTGAMHSDLLSEAFKSTGVRFAGFSTQELDDARPWVDNLDQRHW